MGHDADSYGAMTVTDLKALAAERGVKVAGVGWPVCCPPSGNKADIVSALLRHGEAASARQSGYDGMGVVELKSEAERLGVKQPGVGWATCCPPDGNKAAILAALQQHTSTIPEHTTPEKQRPSESVSSPPFTGPREPISAAGGQDFGPYRPQTTCGRQTTAALAETDAKTHELLEAGLKLPPHVPLICTSFRSSNLKDVDGRVEFWMFLRTCLRCEEEEAKLLAANVNTWREAWEMTEIKTMLDYSHWYTDEATLALCMTSMPEEAQYECEPSVSALAAAAKVFEEVGVADPWSVCDYLRERASWNYDSVFIDAEAYGMYAEWHTVYQWAQRNCEVMVMFISRGW